ncbi:MAG: hypothetical protein WCK77_19430 [Verrucomicrobiota bacterium]
MKTAILLSTLFISSLSASARIGETLEQCRARYGPEHPELVNPKSANKVYWFVKNGYVMEIMFDAGTGKARLFSIFKMNGDSTKAPGAAMTEDEKTILLNLNGNGKKWIIKATRVETEDHLYVAYGMGNRSGDSLTIICQVPDKVAAKESADKAAGDAKKSLQGF